MTATLLIAFPDIPVRATKTIPAQSYHDFYPHWNLFRGERYHHAKLATATASAREIVFNLDAATTANYYILSRADLLLAQGMTAFTLSGSNDGSSYTTVKTDSIYSNNLTGLRGQDIISVFPESTAYQYWKSSIASASAATRFSKLYFGKLFDIGVAPDDFIFDLIVPKNQEFIADSNAVHKTQTGLTRYQFQITWDGVTDAKCAEFESLLRANYQGFFLYAPEQRQILNNNELVHVKATSFRKEDNEGFPDWNRLIVGFEEMIG